MLYQFSCSVWGGGIKVLSICLFLRKSLATTSVLWESDYLNFSQISLMTTLTEIYPLWRYALPWERTRTSNCFLVLLNFFSKSQHTRHVFLQCSSHSTGLPQLYQLLYFLISHFLKYFSFSLFQLFLLFFRLQFGKGNASALGPFSRTLQLVY